MYKSRYKEKKSGKICNYIMVYVPYDHKIEKLMEHHILHMIQKMVLIIFMHFVQQQTQKSKMKANVKKKRKGT